MSDDSANAPPPADVASVGRRLKQARVEQGLALEQAAEEMRLSVDVLGALEADRFDILGAQVFVRGHLRQYAQLLGLDADELMRRYEAEDHPSDEPIVSLQPIRLRDAAEFRVWVSVGIVLLVIVALLFWWWANPEDITDSSVTRSQPSLVEPVPEVESDVLSPVGEQPQVDPIPVPVQVPEEEPQPAVSDAVPPGGADAVDDALDRGGAVTLNVEISFDEDCWVEIIGGDDRRLFYGLGRAGARSRFEASPPMSVLFGNVDGVRMSVNGAPYAIPAGSRQGNLARFVVVADE